MKIHLKALVWVLGMLVAVRLFMTLFASTSVLVFLACVLVAAVGIDRLIERFLKGR